ncbi:HAMP domain-containing protein, partial [Cognatilysobacter bugurensis]|uniref:HAMP domain-containing protein n=1 Tax=Cognatilysobacter bugurensis TaxID=543356 RepID=UPI00167606FB
MKLRHLSIGQRLAVGFSLIIALLVVLTATGVQRVRLIDAELTTINQINSVKQRYAINFRGSVHDRAIELRDVVLLDSPETVAKAEQQIDTLAAAYARSAGPLDTLVEDPASPDATERSILADIKAIEARTLPLIEQVRALRASGQREAARTVLIEQAKPAFVDWLAAINRFIDLEEAKNKRETAIAMEAARGFAWLMVALCGIAIVLGTAIAWIITRTITQPLTHATQVAQAIAAGDVDNTIDATGRDEVAALLTSMQTMQAALQVFVRAQDETREAHDAGRIDHRMDEAAFPGAYGRMAGGINALLASHIGTQMHLIEVVRQYARGDLSAQIERYPGKKAEITAAVDAVKAGMQSINAEIKALVDAGVAGDL